MFYTSKLKIYNLGRRMEKKLFCLSGKVTSYKLQVIGSRGFSLVEMIIYITILSVLLISIINVAVSISRSSFDIKNLKSVANSAQISLNRFTNEIRKAYAVNSESVLDSNPGILVLDSSSSIGQAKNVRFYKSGTTLFIDDGEGKIGQLTDDNVYVDSVIYRKIVATSSVAVKIEMTLSSGEGSKHKIDNFYTTVVLRGSY